MLPAEVTLSVPVVKMVFGSFSSFSSLTSLIMLCRNLMIQLIIQQLGRHAAVHRHRESVPAGVQTSSSFTANHKVLRSARRALLVEGAIGGGNVLESA